MGWFIFLGLIVLVAFWAIGAYNRMIGLRNRFKNAFAQIDVQLKRRYDLIPNLVETARAYMKHERETLEAVIAARDSAKSADQAADAKARQAEDAKDKAKKKDKAKADPTREPEEEDDR